MRQNDDGSFPPRQTDGPIHWVVHVPGVLPLFDGDGIRPGDSVEVLRRGPDTAKWRRFFRQRARTDPLRNPTV